MNLKSYLTIRIALVAIFCMLIASWYVAWRAERELREQAMTGLGVVARQVVVQMSTIASGLAHADRLPVWSAEIESLFPAGYCIRYADAMDRMIWSSCRGTDPGDQEVPAWFAAVYRMLLSPEEQISIPISWRARDYGRIVGLPDGDSQMAKTWRETSTLAALMAANVLAVCVLAYVVIHRALRPAREILSGLERFERGDLSSRLPRFRLIELQRVSEGFNRLAAGIEQSLAQRAELTRKLVNLQEEERRYLARELHDELGQCLAAMKAVAASVAQTAEQECPHMKPDADRLTQIAQHMMEMVRTLLRRLRPPGIDELGLVESLRSLIEQWRGSAARIELVVRGDFERVPQTISVSIYRIVQECLTNSAKHAGASTVTVLLERDGSVRAGESTSHIDVTVEDDGVVDGDAVDRNHGMGLLGMRERVAALGGQLSLRARRSSGLIIHASIPVASA